MTLEEYIASLKEQRDHYGREYDRESGAGRESNAHTWKLLQQVVYGVIARLEEEVLPAHQAEVARLKAEYDDLMTRVWVEGYGPDRQ